MTILEYLKDERQSWLEMGYNKEVTYEDVIRKKYVEALIDEIENGILSGDINP